jgi:hypothetical protein
MKSNKNHRNPVLASTLGALLVLFSSISSGAIVNSNLSFSSQDQSMWGSGGAFQLDETVFLGKQWNESVTAGGFANISGPVPNPALAVWTAENALYGLELTAYGIAYAAYEVAHAAWWICPFLCPSEPQPPSVPTSPGPAPPLTIDVSLGYTGLEATATTTGRVGFELGVKIDSGSVDAVVTYDTTVITPENNTVAVGEFIVLQTNETLTGDDLSSQFPTMSAELSVVLEVSAGFTAEGCILSICDDVGFNTGTIGGTLPIIGLNQGGNFGIEYFGGAEPLNTILGVAGLPTGMPAVIEIPAPSVIPGVNANIATITAHIPQPNATYDGIVGDKLTASGQDDLLDVSLDVDTLVSLGITCPLSGGCFGGLFGGAVDLGLGFGLSYDLINVEIGPKIDLVQNFELTPTLLVDLQFSRPVMVAGLGEVTSLASEFWENLPAMAFMDGTTDILPTFHLGYFAGGKLFDNAVSLFNELFLDVDGNIKIDIGRDNARSLRQDIPPALIPLPQSP